MILMFSSLGLKLPNFCGIFNLYRMIVFYFSKNVKRLVNSHWQAITGEKVPERVSLPLTSDQWLLTKPI